jgi:hypothetical protein
LEKTTLSYLSVPKTAHDWQSEENVTFSQPAAPVFSQESFDVFDFPTQMFEEFVDDGILEMFGLSFDDEGILDFVDDSSN